jgi:hypothetical protein
MQSSLYWGTMRSAWRNNYRKRHYRHKPVFWRGVALPGTEAPDQLFIFFYNSVHQDCMKNGRFVARTARDSADLINLILSSCRQTVLPLCSNAITPDGAASLSRSCSARPALHAGMQHTPGDFLLAPRRACSSHCRSSRTSTTHRGFVVSSNWDRTHSRIFLFAINAQLRVKWSCTWTCLY